MTGRLEINLWFWYCPAMIKHIAHGFIKITFPCFNGCFHVVVVWRSKGFD